MQPRRKRLTGDQPRTAAWAAPSEDLHPCPVRREAERKRTCPTGEHLAARPTPTAWLVNSRRLARDYQYLPAVHEAMVKWAMIRIMVRSVATTGPQAEDVPAQA